MTTPASSSAPSPMQTEVQNNNIITRTLHVNITGSLANFAMAGPLGAVWKPVDGKQSKVFGAMGDNADAQLVTNQLRTALIHEVTLLEHQSSFPVPLGVKINCLPPQEYTDLGQAYSYTVLPGSKLANSNTIYRCDISAENSQNWRQDYPKYNALNLETEGIIDVKNMPYAFVKDDHPIIALLRANASLIGCNIDEQKKVDNDWYKITRQVVTSACQTLRSKVLSKIASNDLNLLQVQIERLGADTWDDINDVSVPLQGFVPNTMLSAQENENAKRMHVERWLSTPCSYMARLQIKYEVQNPQ